jgi:hypothetical protein
VLKRIAAGGAVEYSVQLRDQSLTFLSDDEGGGEIRRDSAWTESWKDVIKSLGRWPWPMLYPRSVDSEYRARVLSAAQQYKGRDGQPARESAVERWTKACRPVE